MSDPYLGEIKLLSFSFAPRGWALCNGQLLAIRQNQALFSILGTMYGGDGVTTFALPNLQGRMPIHAGKDGGDTYAVGQTGGETSHTLTIMELPAHNHPGSAGTTTNVSTPVGNIFATTLRPSYAATANTTMSPAALASAGGNQPHENQGPFSVLNFAIALQGIFPSRN